MRVAAIIGSGPYGLGLVALAAVICVLVACSSESGGQATAGNIGAAPTPELVSAVPRQVPEEAPTVPEDKGEVQSAVSGRGSVGLPARIVAPQSRPPDRDLTELAVRLRGVKLHGPTPDPVGPMTVGAQEDFWITNLDNGTARGITATLSHVSDHAYWFIDDATPVDRKALSIVAARYESEVRPAVVRTFGDIANPGIDGDPRLVVLHTQLDGAAGYFGSKDSFPQEVHPHSNEREIIYLDTRLLARETDGYMGVLAHELQHAVHFNQDIGEESWVNEGLAEVSTAVAGYEIQSPPAFVRRPHTQLNYWPAGPHSKIPHYGGSALFFSYLSQRVGGTASLIDLVTEPLDGIPGVQSFLEGHGLSWPEVFSDWVVANYLDADDERFGYLDREIQVGPVRTITPGAGQRDRLPQFSARYYRVDTTSQGGSITFDGDTEVRQVGVDCAVAPTCWWSGRGDGIDSKLTGELDLTGLDNATLQFKVWYEIEDGWDYGYVQASDDGGKTWHILEGLQTTTKNPSGNGYGPGYTGASRGWKQESIDLSQFAGGRVLIRFEYVTDDAVYLDGMLIDDITVPELDSRVGSGWNAQGFGLAGPKLAQTFVVQVVRTTPDGRFTVSRIPLDGGNSGSFELNGLGDGGATVVIVSPTTAETRHPAGYLLEFRQQDH